MKGTNYLLILLYLIFTTNAITFTPQSSLTVNFIVEIDNQLSNAQVDVIGPNADNVAQFFSEWDGLVISDTPLPTDYVPGSGTEGVDGSDDVSLESDAGVSAAGRVGVSGVVLMVAVLGLLKRRVALLGMFGDICLVLVAVEVVEIFGFNLIGDLLRLLRLLEMIVCYGQQGETYTVTLKLPTHDHFRHTRISCISGSVVADQWSPAELEIDFWGGNSTVSITQLFLRGTSWIKTTSSVSIDTVTQVSHPNGLFIDTPGDAFEGSAKIQHDAPPQLSNIGHCSQTQSTGVTALSCALEHIISTVDIVSEGNVELDLGGNAPDLCTAAGDPTDVHDLIIPHRNIPTQTPLSTWDLMEDTWKLNIRWGTTGSEGTLSNDEISLVCSTDYKPSNLWAFCPECLPGLNAGRTYTLSFDVKLDIIGDAELEDLSLALQKNKARGYNPLAADILEASPENFLVIVRNITQGETIGDTYASYSVTFTPEEDLYSGYFAWDRSYSWESTPTKNINDRHASLALRFSFSRDLGSNADVVTLRNVKLEQASFEIDYTVIDEPNELITIPLPDPELDHKTWERTECPHLDPSLKLWNDPDTWGGTLPDPDSVITLPENTRILVTSCSFTADIYRKIIVPSTSELIFNDAPISLDVRAIFVQGNLTIGSETCRILNKITITLHPGQEISNDFGDKGIGVSFEGEIDIHGKQYHSTWTRLSASARSGDDRIYIQDETNWEPGQEIVIATTIYQDDWFDQNEVVTIKSIKGNVILLEEPLKYYHHGGSDYQAEVGLLSRRIVIQGNDDNTHGGHIMIMGKGRISGVLATRMGQRNIIGRYPFHFHLGGDRPESYITDSACKDTYFRCVTIHGTNMVHLERHVSYNSVGHTYYLEDGVEELNYIAHNLAVKVNIIGTPAAGAAQRGVKITESTDIAQPADITASGFYITNANNYLIGNAASGGWAGFSFPNLFTPHGPHGDVQIDPSARTNLVFEGNTAHSAGYYWGDGSCIYVGGQLWTDRSANLVNYHSGRQHRYTREQANSEVYSRSDSGGPGQWTSTGGSTKTWQRFNNTKTFMCKVGIGHWGNRAEYYKYESYDNQRGAVAFGESWISEALFVGKSSNPLSYVPYTLGFQFYDTSVKTVLYNVEFRNFHPLATPGTDKHRENYCITALTHSDKFIPQGISATKYVSFTNVSRNRVLGHKVRNTSAAVYFNIVDYDGTVTGTNEKTLIASHSNWWNYRPECSWDTEWEIWICPMDDEQVAHLYLEGGIIQAGEEPPHGTYIDAGTVYLWGDGRGNTRHHPLTTMPGITGMTETGWYLFFRYGTPSDISVKVRLVPDNHYVMLAIGYPASTTFEITDGTWGKSNTVAAATSYADLKNSNEIAYFFDGTHLYIKVVDKYPTQEVSYGYKEATIFIQNYGYWFDISATCPGGDCTVPETVPTRTL